MKLTYDRVRNLAYLSFGEELLEVEILAVSDDLNVDLTSAGELYAIEFLNVDEIGIVLTITNQATDATVEVALP